MSVETPELRAELSAAEINDLPDEDFAYIEDGGEKDDEGKTTPRSLRHYPVQDQAHAEDALARANAQIADGDDAAKRIAEKALPKIKAAVAKFRQKASRSAAGRRKKERHRAVPLIPEVRIYAAEELEIREADTEGNLVTITGAPIIYDKWYSVVDRRGEFRERMLPGVAKDVIGGDTRFLFNHDGLPLARTLSGTLVLDDGPAKLKIGATVDIRQHTANDLVIAVERGDVTDMSVGFLADGDKWNPARDERSVHHFKSMPDVSAVTYPASPTTHLEIAQRMAQAAGVEPGARIRRLYADYRAGQVLSAANKGVVIDAVKALHGVLQSAGFDPAELIEGAGPGDDVDEITNSPDGSSADAADGGDALPPGDAAGPDSRAVEVDPGENMRQAPATRVERRAASESFNDQQQAVYQALLEKLGDGDGDCDLWIMDCADDWAVYQSHLKPEGIFKVAYSVDAEGDVTLDGEPMRVNVKTTYEPADDDDAQQRGAPVLSELRAQFRAREYRQRQAA